MAEPEFEQVRLGEPEKIPTSFVIMSGEIDVTAQVLERLFAAARKLDASSGQDADDARAIGAEINEIGALPLMQACWYRVRESCGRDAATWLEYRWDGVGDWLS